jgi:1,2-diacylglycerol 3-alpha-glucosyltransferase
MARIGMVSILFHRGQSEVTKTLRQALIDNGHEVFIFARMGGVYGQAMQEKDDPYWKLPNLYYFPKYDIPAMALRFWAKAHELDAVIFNEEYDFSLPAEIHQMGLKTIHYVDFMHPDWGNQTRAFYHQLWSATNRTMLQIQSEWGTTDLAHYIGWGIHPSVPYLGDQEPDYDFFSNQGWLGINLRKGVDLLLEAFSKLNSVAIEPKFSLLVHAQVPIDTIGITDTTIPGLVWQCQTVPAPGLYYLGKVVVQPSRLEGLGLTIPEAMYQGRPVVTTDAAPMNEFVRCPGHLAKVASVAPRSDGLSFPEHTADVESLANRMDWARKEWAFDRHAVKQDANIRFSWPAFCQRIQDGLDAIGLRGVPWLN